MFPSYVTMWIRSSIFDGTVFIVSINKYNVIRLDITEFTAHGKISGDIVDTISNAIRKDVCTVYPEISPDGFITDIISSEFECFAL